MPLHPATLEWSGGSPYSADFKDVYFSPQGVAAETEYVFFAHNQLPQRWANGKDFTLAETGFGTGLNFLLTAQLWQRHAPKHATLHYISIEKHPLPLAALHTIYAHYPDLNRFSQDLLAHYPPLVRGFHTLTLAQGRIRLLLIFDDIAAALAALQAKADAWFLDGFTPARNPAMWTLAVCQSLAEHTQTGGTFSTYTATSQVRRQLQAVGFEVRKDAGFGKREMLYGGLAAPTSEHAGSTPPWFCLPPPQPAKQVIILGAGIAGCAAAFCLAQRGYQVRVLEQHAQPGQAASGNPKGVLRPKLTTDHSALSCFYTHAFFSTQQLIHTCRQAGHTIEYDACGVVELATQARQQQRQAKQQAVFGSIERHLLPLSAAQVTHKLPMVAAYSGQYFPQGAWVNPQQLCAALLAMYPERIGFVPNTQVQALTYADAHWHCHAQQDYVAPIVIVANSYQATQLAQCQHLPMDKIRGQMTQYPATANTQALAHILCADAYLIPATDGEHVLGASFEADVSTPTLQAHSQRETIQHLNRCLSEPLSTDVALRGRVSFRCTAGDYLPLVGPVPERAFHQKAYANLSLGRPMAAYPQAQDYPGLFISSAHGARGLTGGVLAAQILAAMISGEPMPVARQTLHAIHPARFWIRRYQRQTVAKR